MEAGDNMSLTGAVLSALGEEGSLILHAGKNLTMDTGSLEAKKDMTENSDNYIRTFTSAPIEKQRRQTHSQPGKPSSSRRVRI